MSHMKRWRSRSRAARQEWLFRVALVLSMVAMAIATFLWVMSIVDNAR